MEKIQKIIDFKNDIFAVEINAELFSGNDFYIAVDDAECADVFAPNDSILVTLDKDGNETRYTVEEIKKIDLKLYELKEI